MEGIDNRIMQLRIDGLSNSGSDVPMRYYASSGGKNIVKGVRWWHRGNGDEE
jgi:hypothetical protein